MDRKSAGSNGDARSTGSALAVGIIAGSSSPSTSMATSSPSRKTNAASVGSHTSTIITDDSSTGIGSICPCLNTPSCDSGSSNTSRMLSHSGIGSTVRNRRLVARVILSDFSKLTISSSPCPKIPIESTYHEGRCRESSSPSSGLPSAIRCSSPLTRSTATHRMLP